MQLGEQEVWCIDPAWVPGAHQAALPLHLLIRTG